MRENCVSTGLSCLTDLKSHDIPNDVNSPLIRASYKVILLLQCAEEIFCKNSKQLLASQVSLKKFLTDAEDIVNNMEFSKCHQVGQKLLKV